MKELLLVFLVIWMVFGVYACSDSDDDDDDSASASDDDLDDDDLDDDDLDDDDFDDDDDASDDDDMLDDDDLCGDDVNSAPELIALDVIVNGTVQAQPVTLTAEDSLAFSIEYFDLECNIAGLEENPLQEPGIFQFLPNQSDIENLNEYYGNLVFGTRLDDIGCSSEVDGAYLVDVPAATVSNMVLPDGVAREYPLMTYIADACGFRSDFMDLDITVIPAD